MTIKRYIKKPIPVEAVQVNRDNLGIIYGWALGTTGKQEGVETLLNIEYIETFGNPEPQLQITIGTLEGDMTARQGDWIIRGVRGEIYPCRSDIFAESYEEEDNNE